MIPVGLEAEVGMLNSVTVPVVVIRPILFAEPSVNQRLPSGPAAMSRSPALAVMPDEYSVATPPVVIFATRFAVCSVNQRLPSGPAVIS